MAYTLIIGNKNYSSWSMRAWLTLEYLAVPYTEVSVDIYTETSRVEVRAFGGETGLVPVLRDGDFAVWDTIAMIEYLHESHGQLWPESKQSRARARSICGEVHSGLTALRDAMPVNIRARRQPSDWSTEVRADIARVIEIWQNCPAEIDGGQWLFGEFSVADIVFAPIATRFRSYGVELAGEAKAYQDRILSHPLVRQWEDLGADEPPMAIWEE